MNKYPSSFDKIRILPQSTRVESRSQCDTSTQLGSIELSVPLISAAMNSLFNYEFAFNLNAVGSLAVPPRNYVHYCQDIRVSSTGLATALEKAELAKNGILFWEQANGYMRQIEPIIKELKSQFPSVFVVGGTVADYDGAKWLEDIGFDAILLNIGVGEVCDTTTFTGVGLPAIASLMDIRNRGGLNIPLILSGGVRSIGEAVISIALGADIVMSGSLFKHCSDTKSGKTGIYYGEASEQNKGHKSHIEGKSIRVESNSETSIGVVNRFRDSLQSAMSYSDSFNLTEFRNKVKFVELQ